MRVYVQEKAEQIDRLQFSLAAALTSEQAHLHAVEQKPPGWTAGKKAHAQWEQQVARQKTRIAQIKVRLDRVGEIEEAAGIYAETKIEELAERKLRLDWPELAQEWDKIQRRQRQALIPTIKSTQSGEGSLRLSLSGTLLAGLTRVAVSFLVAVSAKTFFSNFRGKGEAFTLGFPNPCSQWRKTREPILDSAEESPRERSDFIGYSRDKRPGCV